MRVAVVTGGNKGIGLCIVRELCKQFDGDVILTARDVSRGKYAVEQLNKEGLDPKFYQLDVTDIDAIKNLKIFLESQYGGLDVLVNNAAIAFVVDSSLLFSEQAKLTIETNFIGPVNIIEIFYPLFRPGTRVVNISSGLSNLSPKIFKQLNDEIQSGGITNNDLRKIFTSEKTTLDELKHVMQKFVTDAEKGVHVENGWPDELLHYTSYHVSKIGLNSLTAIIQQKFDKDPREDMIINACSPGSVLSDMNPYGSRTPEQGAECPVYLALLPFKITSPKGKFLSPFKEVQDWH